MLPNKKYASADVLRIVKTRAPLIVVPAALGLLVALIVSSRLPNVYQAETLIQIVPQRVPDAYVRSTVTIKTRGSAGRSWPAGAEPHPARAHDI